MSVFTTELLVSESMCYYYFYWMLLGNPHLKLMLKLVVKQKIAIAAYATEGSIPVLTLRFLARSSLFYL